MLGTQQKHKPPVYQKLPFSIPDLPKKYIPHHQNQPFLLSDTLAAMPWQSNRNQ
jgi:hypothetical protein